MVRLTSTLSRLNNCKILVAGDLMLDTYTIGKARRISPEAPVAVVQVVREENRAGGAGNVALNLLSLGLDVTVLSRAGNDATGKILLDVLKNENINTSGIALQQGYNTPVKNRIIADNQQIVRIDHEQITQLPEMLEQQIIDSLPTLFEGVAAVAISDYGKGFLTKTLLAAIIETARKRSIPVITDPKGVDFTKYSGTTIIKPNLSEAYAAAGQLPGAPLEIVASKLLGVCQAEMLMVTRSEEGISIFNQDGTRLDFPVKVREVKDVTGAGDTVLAMLTCATANGLSTIEAVQLSNVAAGIAIERFGCARVSLTDLAERLLDSDVTNKVFDEEHLFALQKVLSHSKYNILSVSASQGMTTPIFKAIQSLSKEAGHKLVIYLSDDECDSGFTDVVASMNHIKFIIIHNESLKKLSKACPPDAIYSIESGEIKRLDSIDDLIEDSISTS